jgi:hypothetical protein
MTPPANEADERVRDQIERMAAALEAIAPGLFARVQTEAPEAPARPITRVDEAAARALFGLSASESLTEQELEELRAHPNQWVRQFYAKTPTPRQ